MPIDDLHGAWRIEESHGWNSKQHPYGAPHTHWLILGHYGIPVIEKPPAPFYYEFRITLNEQADPPSIRVAGTHGGVGYFDLADGLLIVSLGAGGVKPPRFESGCGNYFAFTRDHDFELPDPPTWCRDEIVNEKLGTFTWHASSAEWTGQVLLPDGNTCEIWAVDDLMPISVFMPTLELVHQWICDHLDLAKTICAEAVHEWTVEMPDYAHLRVQDIVKTIALTAISASNGRIHCWASTSIPIDHSIRLWIDVEDEQVRARGASIEG